MCGRFSLTHKPHDWAEYFGLLHPFGKRPEMPPLYNIAPTQPILTIAADFNNERRTSLVRWGLIPAWVKDPKDFTLLINARAETAIDKPSFKTAMRHRRVLIPASGFYEWKRFGKGRKSQPFWVRPHHGGVFAFGGLTETWSDPGGSEMDTGCIISTDTNDSFRRIHNRLPLVIQPEDFERWLDCKTQEPREVLDLMQPVADDFFEAIPVGDAVNKVANSSPEIQQRVEIEEPQASKSADDDQLSMF